MGRPRYVEAAFWFLLAIAMCAVGVVGVIGLP